MTICIATDGFPPQVGGIATFNQHLVNLLTGAGHKVVVLYIGYTARDQEEDLIIREGNLVRVVLQKTYFKFIREWKPYFKPGGFDAPNWIAIGLSMREWLQNNHKQYEIDIIEASDYGGCGVFLVDKDIPPVVVTGHGSLLQFSRHNYTKIDDHFKVVAKLEELSFVHADAVIAHSHLNQRDLETLFKRDISLATIPWSFPPNPDEKVVSNDQLLVIGGLQPIKGIYDTAKAMQELRSKSPGTRLTWIGNDTWLAPGQQQMSVYLQKTYPDIWQQNLSWKNTQDFAHTQMQIAGAALIIIPSCFETFNYVALEAAYYKKPILATSGTGASAYFKHGHDAWVIPPNDPGALASAIIYLSENPELKIQLGANAYTTLVQKFTAVKMLEERMHIYETAIINRSHRSIDDSHSYSFVTHYRHSFRKYYYCMRQWIKKLIGR